jgi:hypothetical protein
MRRRSRVPTQRGNSDHAAWIKGQDDQKLVAEIVRGLGLLEAHSVIKTHGQDPCGLRSLLRCLNALGFEARC